MIETVNSGFDAAAQLDQTIEGRFTNAVASSLPELSVRIGNETIDLIRTATQHMATFARAHLPNYIPPEGSDQCNVNVYQIPF